MENYASLALIKVTLLPGVSFLDQSIKKSSLNILILPKIMHLLTHSRNGSLERLNGLTCASLQICLVILQLI